MLIDIIQSIELSLKFNSLQSQTFKNFLISLGELFIAYLDISNPNNFKFGFSL